MVVSFVYYERSLNPTETGSVNFQISSLDPDHCLALGTSYKVYLGIKVGPHLFYSFGDYVAYSLPDTASLTQITMNKAGCTHKRDASGKLLPELSASATITNPPNSGNAGFLFLKQGASLTASSVLAKQLQEGTLLPTTQNTSIAHSGIGIDGVLFCPTNLAQPLEINGVEDTTGVLEKGATYDVYGYVWNGNNYFISANSRSVTLPKLEIQVSMQSVENLQLFAIKDASLAGGYHIHQFNLELTGHIGKMENATNPVAGFVFVRDRQSTDKGDICRTIESCIRVTNNVTAGNVINVNSGTDHVVCVAEANISTGQSIRYPCDLRDNSGPNASTSHLDLKSDYQVYFWVADDDGKGDLFLSNVGQALELFYVEGDGITAVVLNHENGNLDLNVAITNQRNATRAEMIFVFLEPDQTIETEKEKGLLEAIIKIGPELKDAIEATGWPWFHHLHDNTSMPAQTHVYVVCGALSCGQEEIKTTTYSDKLTTGVKYTLGLLVRSGGVFYYMPSAFTLQPSAFTLQKEDGDN